MSLNAFVACRCFVDRRIERPRFADLLILNECGEPELKPEIEHSDELKDAVEEWLEKACPHPYMHVVDERIGSHFDLDFLYGVIQQAPGRLPRKNLLRIFYNPGATPISARVARSALKELKCLRESGEWGDEFVLIREDTQELVTATLSGQQWPLMARGPLLSSLCEHGFIVTEQSETERPCKVLFLSTHFEQLHDSEIGVYRFTDFASGRTAQAPIGIRGNADAEVMVPVRFRVLRQRVNQEILRQGLDPLQRVLEASAETGNPMMWC